MRLTLLVSSLVLMLLLLPNTARADIGDIHCDMPKGQLAEAVYNCIHDKISQMISPNNQNGLILTVFNKVNKAIVAVLTLAIMFFAIKFALYGTRQPQVEFFTMMLKMVIVASLLFGIRDGRGILLVTDTIMKAGSGFQSLVLVNNGTFGIDGQNIFQRMDTALFKIYGVKDPTKEIKMDKDMAGVNMMGGLILAGPLGAKAFLQGGAALAMLVGSFMVALYINIVSLIAVTFLLTLSPIILPLVLFPATERMFQKWRGQLISYTLQPMVMTVFISMMFLMLGDLVGTLDNFIETARDMGNDPGIVSTRNAFTTATAVMGADKPGVAANLGTERVATTDAITGGNGLSGIGSGQAMNMFTKGIGTKDFKLPIIPFNHNQLTGLGSQMVVLLIVCGAMFRFMKELPEWASELAGGDRTVPNLAQLAGPKQVEKQFEKKK